MASFPPFLEFKCFTLGLNRVHELTGLHHLTRAIIAVIYCNNFQYGQGDKMQHLCHGCPVYSQVQVPAFKFMSPEEFTVQIAKSEVSSEPRSEPRTNLDRSRLGEPRWIELDPYKSGTEQPTGGILSTALEVKVLRTWS